MHLRSYVFGGCFFLFYSEFVWNCPSASKNIEFSDSSMPEKEVDTVFSLLLMQTNNAACPILCKVKLYKALIINTHINWFMQRECRAHMLPQLERNQE